MNRVLIAFVGLAFVLASVHATSDIRADLPENVTIYFFDDDYKAAVGDLPAGYMGSYQISVQGATYSSSGSSANVTSTGLVKPKGTLWYWKNGVGTTTYRPDADKITVRYSTGVTTVTVTVGNTSQKIKFDVKNYAPIYIEQKMNRIISEAIRDGMTPLEKLTAITVWIANNTDYNGKYYQAQDMLIFDGGDCWASTETIIKFCKKLSIDCRERRGNQDIGAASGHKNAIAYIGNKYYVADAGYGGKKPRNYHVKEEIDGFASGLYSVNGTTMGIIYQYDGLNKTVTIPSQHNGNNITGLGKNGVTVFIFGTVESIRIPAFITNIWEGALSGCVNLTTVTVDSKNPNYESDDGLLFTKGMKKLLFTPTNKKSLTIGSTVTEIGVGAINDCNLDDLVIPGTVKTIGASALANSKVRSLTIKDGVETIGASAFSFMKTGNNTIVLPDSVTSLGRAAFSNCNVSHVVLPKNLKVIPRMCFNLSSIVDVVMPETVETLEKQAFYECRKLVNITIPKSVTHIEGSVFDGYWGTNLKNIHYMGSVNQWGRILFDEPIPEGINVFFYGTDDGDAASTLSVWAAFVLFMSVFLWLF